MELGFFTMPSHPPERSLRDGHEWDLQVIRWLDELGYKECWIGEHHTAPWEPHPSPDLLVAQALLQTKRMRIGPGGFLMPYHHPAELANRIAEHSDDPNWQPASKPAGPRTGRRATASAMNSPPWALPSRTTRTAPHPGK